MYLSIRNKILAAHFGMVLFVGLTIGAIGYSFITTHVNIDDPRDLEFMATMLKSRILEVLAQRKSTLLTISERLPDSQNADVHTDNSSQYDLTKYLTSFVREFPVLSYVNLKGDELRAVNGIIFSGYIRDASIFIEEMSAQHGIVVSYEQNNIDLGVPAVTLTAAKYSGGQPIGSLRGSVPVADIAGVLSEVEVQRSGVAIVLDDRRTIIYAGKRPDMAGKSVDAPVGKGVKPAVLKKGVGRAFISGVDSIVAIVPIEQLSLWVAVVIPYAEFSADVTKIKYATAGILIFALALSGVIYTLITRHISTKLINPPKDEAGVLTNSFNQMLMELQNTRDELIIAKEYTDNLIETIAIAVLVLTEDAEIVKVNKSVHKMLGRTEDELLNKRIDEVFESDTVAEILYNEVMRNGYVKDVEVVLMAKYGVRVPVIFSASAIYGSDGNTIEEIVCSAQNITQLKRMQKVRDMHLKELETANQHLKDSRTQLVQAEKLASLGQMLAGVAHEINTPLGIGITLSSTITRETEQIKAAFDVQSLRKEQLKEYIDDMIQSSSLIFKSLTRTADLVKSFKMVSADQITQDRRRFRLKEYIEEIMLSLQPKMKRLRHNIEIICDEGIELDSYPGAIAQIITNLLMNSLMHAYDKGVKGNIMIEASATEDGIIIEYKDDGKGMPQEYLKRIYDPFFTTMRGSGGTGLGLHIVHSIVTQTLGGSIECQSELNAGTTFTIALPVMKKEAAA